MSVIIAGCLILITIALLFGADAATGLLGFLLQIIFFGFILLVIALVFFA